MCVIKIIADELGFMESQSDYYAGEKCNNKCHLSSIMWLFCEYSN